MTPGSLSPLSKKTQALLAAERDIVAQPAPVRRRALLRARAAMRHTRGLGAEARRFGKKRAGPVVALAALLATSAAAAWLTISPAASVDPNEPASVHPPSHPVSIGRPSVSKPASQAISPAPEPSASSDESSVVSTKKRVLPPKRRLAIHKPSGGAPEELLLLDQARRALVAGDFRAALGLIQRHQSAFPNSQLSEEREALRVQALKGSGQSKKAGRAASDFQSRYPNSVLAPELSKDRRPAP